MLTRALLHHFQLHKYKRLQNTVNHILPLCTYILNSALAICQPHAQVLLPPNVESPRTCDLGAVSIFCALVSVPDEVHIRVYLQKRMIFIVYIQQRLAVVVWRGMFSSSKHLLCVIFCCVLLLHPSVYTQPWDVEPKFACLSS